MTTRRTGSQGRMSGLGNALKPPPIERLWSASLGQSYPQDCPSPEAQRSVPNGPGVLGEPLSIREAAELIGCSAWTIRQRYIPKGLPHLRSGPAGKLIFYRQQVVRWILQEQTKQQKGGR
jgi:hypothetical protein